MPSPSNAAGSVEVQAPPGLEAVNGFRGPAPLITSGSPAPGSIGPIAPPKPEGLKEELVREVTAAVREHIEWKTAAAVDTLWQKGQRAMQHLQQQQLNQTSQLQSQLVACAEAHQQLQRENAMLRSGLEALMKHLTLVLGAPPHAAGMPPPGIPPPCTPGATGVAASSQANADSNAASSTRTLKREVSNTSEGGVFLTPFGTPVPGAPSAAEEFAAELAAPGLSALPGFPVGPSSVGGTGSETPSPNPAAAAASAAAAALQAPCFSLTLRRADNVPLGLDVVGDPNSDALLVEGIRLGGAVEAWNRQCHGDSREIRRGDRIIMINGVKDADSMKEECLNKHLLRMSVVRGEAASHTPTSAAVAAAAASGSGGLRAEAHEFVPSWGASTTC